MSNRLVVLLFSFACALSPVLAQAPREGPVEEAGVQDAQGSSSLAGGHSVMLGVGLLADTRVDPAGAGSSGFLGSISYTYWPGEAWTVEVSASVLDADASPGHTASVTSLLFGTRYFPPALRLASEVRPHVGAAVGPYMGSEASPGRVRTETVLGARLGAGLDVYPAHWLRLGVRAGYHAVPNFGEPIGEEQGPRGPEMAFEMGVRFGG